MRMQDVMERPCTVGPDTSVQEALALARGSLIVVAGNSVTGVISDHDLLAVPEMERADTRVTAVLRKIPSLAPDDTIKEAANVMRSRGAECVPVVADGKLVGSFSVSRLMDLVGRGALHVADANGRTILKSRGTRPHRSGV